MNDQRLIAPWDIPLAELNDHLRMAGVEPVKPGEAGTLVRDLDVPTRATLVAALRESVRHARQASPPVEEWFAASESLVLNDDGSDRAREQADRFWSDITQRVYGSLALTELGDLSEFPVFIELLRHEPAGHLTELAADVVRHYIDPRDELDESGLLQRAEEWWQRLGSTKFTKEDEEN